jgi:hypothetical protein
MKCLLPITGDLIQSIPCLRRKSWGVPHYDNVGTRVLIVSPYDGTEGGFWIFLSPFWTEAIR